MNAEVRNNNSEFRYKTAKNIALLSATFSLILSILLIANYVQTKSVDPLNSKAINNLMLKLQNNPDDLELKEQIRALDLLARKAYFIHKWQIKTGSYLLFVFVLIFFISLKSLSSLKRQFPDLTEAIRDEDSWENNIISKRYFAYGTVVIFTVALLAGIFSKNELKVNTVDASVNSVDASTEIETSNNNALTNIEKIRENWPQFRGPEGNGIVYNNENAPAKWNGETGENIIWKIQTPLKGFNSPIIWEGKVFLSGSDKKNQSVFCFNAENGNLLWECKLNNIPGSPDPKPKVMEHTGYAAPTMATNGKGVYVIFGTGDIAGIDFAGKQMWAKNLGSPVNHYGHSSSLALHGTTLLIQFDQSTGGRLIGINAETGEHIYEQARDIEISWASPILINSGTRPEVVLSANPFVISYEPATGNEIWRFKCMSGEVGPSLAYSDGIVFACNDYARLAAIKLGKVAELLWESDEDLSEVSSPVANKDMVIMAASFGTVSCFDSKTGKKLWYYEPDDGFYSSPLIANGKIYLMDVSGLMHIIKADKTLELISKNPLGEKASTTPAFYKDKIFIRGEKSLFCIGNKD